MLLRYTGSVVCAKAGLTLTTVTDLKTASLKTVKLNGHHISVWTEATILTQPKSDRGTMEL